MLQGVAVPILIHGGPNRLDHTTPKATAKRQFGKQIS